MLGVGQKFPEFKLKATVSTELKTAFAEYGYVGEHMPDAIDQMSADKITDCSDHLKSGNQIISEASSEIRAMSASH